MTGVFRRQSITEITFNNVDFLPKSILTNPALITYFPRREIGLSDARRMGVLGRESKRSKRADLGSYRSIKKMT